MYDCMCPSECENMGRAPSHKKVNAPKPKWAVEQARFQRSTKYPECRGTFPDCPPEIKPDIVDPTCNLCPIYRQR